MLVATRTFKLSSRRPLGGPLRLVRRGEALPANVTKQDVEALVAAGLLAERAPPPVEVPAQRLRTTSRWCLDPAELAGKSRDALVLIACGLDDHIEPQDLAGRSMAELVQLLTVDFDPAAKKGSPEKSSDAGAPPPERLARARARAQDRGVRIAREAPVGEDAE
jgi:hypothetical protein